MSFAQQIGKVKKKLNSKFVRNLGWLGGAEIANRIFRLATTVVLARFLTPYDYGLAAIVLTVHEITHTFTRIGVASKIIQADKEELEVLCNSAYWLNWVTFIGLFFIQCIAAFPVAWFYRDNQLILPICVSGIVYLMIPISLIQAALTYRESRLNITAVNNTIQSLVSNSVSVFLAWLLPAPFKVWAVVLPKVFSTPVWVYIYYTSHSWRPTKGFTTEYWKEIFGFGKNILGVQLLQAMRNYLDYLIVGRFLGIKELGIYYFAFNAGLGISLSVTKAINGALLPDLCAVREDFSKLKNKYWSSLKVIALIIIPLVFFQSSLAPLYVPIIFGQQWTIAIPVLILICLSAIPRPFAEAASQLLITVGKPDLDLRWNVWFTAVFVGGLFLGVGWGAIGVATAVLLIHMVLLPLFVMWVMRYVFQKKYQKA